MKDSEKMNIDFNNVRVQTIHSYNELVKMLNEHIEPSFCGRKTVSIFTDELEEVLQKLRAQIGAIACTFDEGNDGFKDVFTSDLDLLMFDTKPDYEEE